jgi:cell wall-associated NlpC family hydrolase
MRYLSLIILGVFFSGVSAFSQEKYTRHTVSKGETISTIAEQYDVKPKAIYEINPNAKKLLKLKSVLLIPIKTAKNKKNNVETVVSNVEKTHEVLAKETPYGIAKQYGVSIEELYKINPELETAGLKEGQKIIIPGTASNKVALQTEVESVKEKRKTASLEKVMSKVVIDVLPKSDIETTVEGEQIVHEVLQKETKYAIARQYGIKVADLEKANPTLVNAGLKIGQKIIIPVKEGKVVGVDTRKTTAKTESKIVVAEKEEPKSIIAVSSPSISSDIAVTGVITHEVVRKETKYAIAKQYGISVAELEKQNPKIARKLIVGCKLSITKPGINNPNEVALKKEIAIVKNAIVANETEGSDDSTANQDFNYSVESFHDANLLDELVVTASDNIGTRYRTGGTSKSGFDCSGLMYSTFGSFDIKLPRSSIEQSRIGVVVNFEEAKKGDLIFFKTNGRRQINHVGMVVEVCDGEIKFIHSSNHGGVIISSTKESYYERNLTQINRVLQ